MQKKRQGWNANRIGGDGLPGIERADAPPLRHDQSGPMPESLITFVHLTKSLLIVAANRSGVPPTRSIVCADYSAFTFACLITARHLAISELMNAAYSAGLLPTGSLACDRIRSWISGLATMRATSV